MSDPSYPAHENPAPRPIVAVIGIVIRDDKVLLVQRANPPDAGRWGFPGGKIELGERIMDAAAREIKEETAITVKPLDVFTAVDAMDYGQAGELHQHFVLVTVLCEWQAGEPIAGDDARDARWFDLSALEGSDLAMSFGVLAVARRGVERLRALSARDRPHA